MSTETPYLLLTPGPLTTSTSVKQTMLRDWCTWDDDYNKGVVQDIRSRIASIASSSNDLTVVPMQGSGTFAVEAAVGTMMPKQGGRLLVCVNGAYGERIAQIASYLNIDLTVLDFGEISPVDPHKLQTALDTDSGITHVAIVHNETTTGMMNPLETCGEIVHRSGRILMVDAMSSFGGIPIDMAKTGIDILVSSANKCIQGVPGFGFIIVRKDLIASWKGQARSLSLDLFDQWQTMEKGNGKWRFTSPTHVVRAFQQALNEFDSEGGITARHNRYCKNQTVLVEGMERLGFKTLLPSSYQSPIITSFLNPDVSEYSFNEFYRRLKQRGFVIYPGKVSVADCFRIGTIGEVYPDDILKLIKAIKELKWW